MNHGNDNFKELSGKWFSESCRQKYSYRFNWMGRPIIQYPQDIVMMQEIIWQVKPDLIIETGIAHGGSLVFYASMLELLNSDGLVLGIDIDIRPSNRQKIEEHPMFKRIQMIEGSSTDSKVREQVEAIARNKKMIMVILDSNHSHQHVLKEMELYSPLVSKGSYLVVMDTVVEDLPADFFPDRPWGQGDNPRTAVKAFLKNNRRFMIDREIEACLMITVAPDGYLKCIKE